MATLDLETPVRPYAKLMKVVFPFFCRPHKQRADVLEINGPLRLNLAIFHRWLIYHVWCCYVFHWI